VLMAFLVLVAVRLKVTLEDLLEGGAFGASGPIEARRLADDPRASVITDPVVIDEILAHRRERRIESPFRPRAPPAR
jgi:hypothetical protein